MNSIIELIEVIDMGTHSIAHAHTFCLGSSPSVTLVNRLPFSRISTRTATSVKDK